MCDYSLEVYNSRKAQIGDSLIAGMYTHGFMEVQTAKEVQQKNAAGMPISTRDVCLTCLAPGTRLDVVLNGVLHRNVEFVQGNYSRSASRDHLHFPELNRTIAVSVLQAGTTAKVLSIPGVNITERGVENVKAALTEHDKTQPTAVVDVIPAK